MSLVDIVTETGQYLQSIPYFPLLHSIHCYATAASLRSQPGAVEFAHDHPLASLAGTLLIVNAGGVLGALALGSPLIGPFVNPLNTLTAVIFWWLVFFGPADVFFKLYKIKPLQYVMMGARETRRCKKILDSVTAAAAVYPGQLIPMVLVGALGGCSGKFLQTTEESLRKGSSDLSRGEFIQISFVTKASLAIATVYTLVHAEILTLAIPHALLICSLSLVTINLAMNLAGLPDPFHPISQVTWRVMSMTSSGVPSKTAAASADKKRD